MADAEERAQGVVDITFLSRQVDDEDAAAVVAVLGAVLQEESDLARVTPACGPSAWQRSQRSVRTPITPGAGRWRSFEG